MRGALSGLRGLTRGGHHSPVRIDRTVIRLPLASLATAWLLLTGGTGSRAAVRSDDCPMMGATYQPNVHNSGWDATHLSYRLKIDGLPSAAGTVRPPELWRFQVFDRHTKLMLSELRLTESCPDGRGLCSIGTRARQADGTLVTDPYSDVVTLNERFVRSAGGTAPRAIVLPGFISRAWDYGDEDVKLGYLTVSEEPMFGSFPSFIIWGRVACGHM